MLQLSRRGMFLRRSTVLSSRAIPVLSSLARGRYCTGLVRRAFSSSSDKHKELVHRNNAEAVEGVSFSGLEVKANENGSNSAKVDHRNDDHASVSIPVGIQVCPEIFDRLPAKCPGCGSIFQSDDIESPGYIRAEKHPEKQRSYYANENQVICQRCFDLRYYNKAIPTLVNTAQVTKFLSHISRRKALILYVVDILDLPGSTFPHLLDIVGPAKRIVIVANKVDMLPQDGRPWLQEKRLREEVLRLCREHGLESGNVKDVCLVSAKEGFGVPQLVQKILAHWDHDGDIYMLGCSNSGKTTLFNTFMDLLNVHKRRGNMLQRSTVSKWPGTTMSLMRFPLGHWMLHKLLYRLRHQKDKEFGEDEVAMDSEIIDIKETSYKQHVEGHDTTEGAIASVSQSSELDAFKPELVDRKAKQRQLWFYDTPGIISENQITSYLTLKEIKLLSPNRWMVPRTLILRPGQTLLLGGLGRLDFLKVSRKSRSENGYGLADESGCGDSLTKANKSIYFTVFASPNLPVHVLNTLKADNFLQQHGGSNILKVPCGDEKRMALFPPLLPHELSLVGAGWGESAADVVLSNAGWVAVTAGMGADVSLKAYTPNGRGVGVRIPALLPTSVTQRGKRGVRHLGHLNPNAYEAQRNMSPQLIKALGHDQCGVYSWLQEAEQVRKHQLALLKERKKELILRKSLEYTPIARLPQSKGGIGLQVSRESKAAITEKQPSNEIPHRTLSDRG
ncbi:nitric oxide-associated protein 1 [Nematostella vectensis]|uniref:nitric oxide-associated protein 1 n=1 Tax=Nematostella vectensis TaxID=45351 RepID=UPI00207777AF|nr:nitric oxide-associated protein 1 [Nematostella vectensis]